MRVAAACAAARRVAALVVALACVGVSPSGAEQGVVRRWDTTLVGQWVSALERHVPGETDVALLGAAAWSSIDLFRLWVDIQILLDIEAHPEHDKFTVLGLQYGASDFRVRVMAFSPVERVEFDRLAARLRALTAATALRRAALLHTDLVTLTPDLVRASAGATASPIGAPLNMSVRDGNSGGAESVSLHWEMARLLLRYVTPDPAADPFVRDWYRATLANGQTVEQYDSLHLRRALRLLPNDPVILLLAGCEREAFASTLFQSFAAARRGQRLQAGIDSEADELEDATRYFQQALARDPALTEARVRLGHVLGRQGRWAESVRELERALQGGPEPMLEYFALLFLGTAHGASGDPTTAAAAFRRAGALTPGARAPHLALARLLREMGDREGSAASLTRALDRPLDDGAIDPWWRYRGVRGHGSAGWLNALRASERRAAP